MAKANDYTPRAAKAYQKRWRHEYDANLDDSGWWKWLLGFDTGFRAGMAYARKRAANNGSPP